MEAAETHYDPAHIAVCSTVHYPTWSLDPSDQSTDTIRGTLALLTLEAAKKKGYYVVVEKGTCSDPFMEAIRKLGIDVVDQEKDDGKTMRRRAVMDAAHRKPDVEVICWLEAEKLSYIQDGGLQTAIETLLRENADIVVPKRSKEAFDTYPTYQSASEQRGNKTYNDLLRTHGLLTTEDPDMEFFFGPLLYRNRDVIHQLFQAQYEFKPNEKLKLHEKVKPEENNNTLLFPVVMALRQHCRVLTQEVFYVHPKAQTQNEESNVAFNRKRDGQRHDLLTGLIHLLRLIDENAKSKLKVLGQD